MAKANGNTLGRSSGSLNAPIAAFTMALILGSYCISSIRTARREAQSAPTVGTTSTATTAARAKTDSQNAWVQQALEESQSQSQNQGAKKN
ncbi:hypothetical protein BO70DRAFT_361065 [Aspergillus heteromorphus CBS 117.55]|uniref:Uncharacterized protein n=1 Tax=Aspergillus heteromorphus CBS 117.55 TaxID=1448321 RepID=A0A317WIE6_9EURO|nr:uncharacterized protein BO70DRAFT_361065 [Aspergillus heteromorphus CBS 117.55]PWY86236.1 hypothetical protein BO70DRAFT_361065 [Aspergillus heteromorphus CBS 117.55]